MGEIEIDPRRQLRMKFEECILLLVRKEKTRQRWRMRG
jgi:hypothetical protein